MLNVGGVCCSSAGKRAAKQCAPRCLPTHARMPIRASRRSPSARRPRLAAVWAGRHPALGLNQVDSACSGAPRAHATPAFCPRWLSCSCHGTTKGRLHRPSIGCLGAIEGMENFHEAFGATHLFLNSSCQRFKAMKSSSSSFGCGSSTGASEGWECSYLEYFVIRVSKNLQSFSDIFAR